MEINNNLQKMKVLYLFKKNNEETENVDSLIRSQTIIEQISTHSNIINSNG